MPVSKRTTPVVGSLADHVAELGDPIACVRHWQVQYVRNIPTGWEDDVLDAGLEGFVDGCLSWKGPAYPLWYWVRVRVRTNTVREITRLMDQRRFTLTTGRTLARYEPDHADRTVQRLVLRQWIRDAALTPRRCEGLFSYACGGAKSDAAYEALERIRRAAALETWEHHEQISHRAVRAQWAGIRERPSSG